MSYPGARVVLLNIGWMPGYDRADKEAGFKPEGGGRYNEKNRGHEALNFEPEGGRYYGYARTPSTRRGLALGRIDPSAEGLPELPGVLVIWVAKFNGNGDPVVVGWYRNATVLAARALPSPGSLRGDHEYVAHTAIEDAVLLPVEERRGWQVRRGPGGIGQANVFYSDEERWGAWLGDLVARVRSHHPGAAGVGTAQVGKTPLPGRRGGPTPVGKKATNWINPKAEGFFARTREGIAWRSQKENGFVVWLAAYLQDHQAPPLRLYPVDLHIVQPVRVFFEAKRSADPIPVRSAVGQLLWYSFLHRRDPHSELCVVVPVAPTPQEVAFVEDHARMLIAWRDGDLLVGGPKATAALARIGVCPPT